jgi:hypothetical protein
VLPIALLSLSLAPSDVVGTWDVTLTANYSTCESVAVGDIMAQQWVFSVKSGTLNVQVVAAGASDSSYTGQVTDAGGIYLQSKTPAGLATIELMPQSDSFTGRRVKANDVPCAIIYDVEMKH